MTEISASARVLAIAVFALVMAGCAGGGSAVQTGDRGGSVEDLPAAAAARGIPAGLSALSGATAGGTVTDVDALVAAAKAAGLAERHVESFTDGKVTFAEYERLYRDFLACAAGDGVQLLDLGLVEDVQLGLDRFEYGVPAAPGERPPDDIVSGCATRHFQAAQDLYFLQNQIPVEEQQARLEAGFVRLYECLIDGGAEFGAYEATSREQLLNSADTYDCPLPLS